MCLAKTAGRAQDNELPDPTGIGWRCPKVGEFCYWLDGCDLYMPKLCLVIDLCRIDVVELICLSDLRSTAHNPSNLMAHGPKRVRREGRVDHDATLSPSGMRADGRGGGAPGMCAWSIAPSDACQNNYFAEPWSCLVAESRRCPEPATAPSLGQILSTANRGIRSS